ncbi:unnamed protein product [Rotaria sp. Silwood2]|nr:unnamed protein product [Rotaria sp. Silwood2]CAF2814030.1 unnamed protein product [Rotaria sp. Silwood2]CAF2962957.1 unnamed protein product [Rotaria sp. Silwood2]CAF3920751.1 unnamed protein product [Rotaria sp. Silwood2]CAF4021813.1 unnamed protein product [Rotaria sp. Silwood2]
MKTENDRQIVIVAHLDDEQCIEPINEKLNELKIHFNEHLKTIPELYSEDDDHDSEYIDGFRMKRRFIKSNHMLLFTNEQDRLIEITEPTRRQSYIDVHKHYRIDLFDLYILSIHLTHKSMSLNDWWTTFKTFITISNIDRNEKQIQLLCAPAFTLPLPKQIALQSASLIEFYEIFKSTIFSIYRPSTSSLMSTITYITPAIQLSFRPKILQWFDERIQNHKRLKDLLNNNCLCLVACGSKKTSFQYDFSLIEFSIINQFNESECQLNIFVKKFAMKYLHCSLDNYFLRTTILWICEIHDLENYHDIFEVWISFMRDVCRKHFLAHYFLENVNIYEEHSGLKDIINTIDYKNINLFIEKLEENLIFPYFHQYNDRLKCLIKFVESQPVLAFKMKVLYNVIVKSKFLNANNSLHEMCSILCHLSFLEDTDQEKIISFWYQQWKPYFLDFDRDDIVLQQPSVDYPPDQLAQHMTTSIFKLVQIDLNQMINSLKSNI